MRSEFLSLISDKVIFSSFSLQISWMTATFSLCTYFYLFIMFGCAGSWLLQGLFSGCGEQGPTLVVGRELLIEVASPVVELRL